jgi:hypothetical protein
MRINYENRPANHEMIPFRVLTGESIKDVTKNNCFPASEQQFFLLDLFIFFCQTKIFHSFLAMPTPI